MTDRKILERLREIEKWRSIAEKEVGKYIVNLEVQLESTKWIPVEEGLPEDGEYVLVNPPYISFVFDDEPRHVLRLRGGKFIYYLGDSVHTVFGRNQPTHWMPLPEPPKGN